MTSSFLKALLIGFSLTILSKELHMQTSTITSIESFQISAAAPITTTNAAEQTPHGKINPYWGSFLNTYQQYITPENNLIVGYTNYQSDHQGSYDFFMGIKGNIQAADLNKMTIPAGRYMLFKAADTSVQAVVATWGEIWNYFNTNTEYQRAYTLDFQLHTADSVTIYIALK